MLELTFSSDPQIRSRIRDLAEEKYGKVPTGDTKPNSWTLLDFGKGSCITIKLSSVLVLGQIFGWLWPFASTPPGVATFLGSICLSKHQD